MLRSMRNPLAQTALYKLQLQFQNHMYFTQFEYATEPNMRWNMLMCIQYLRLKMHKSDIKIKCAEPELLLLTRTKK